LQHLRYEDQLAYKTAQVQDAMTRIGKLPDVPVAPMLESPQPFNYRDKVLYHYEAAHVALGLVHGARRRSWISRTACSMIRVPMRCWRVYGR
jgi:tRNA/tmRNA/rRNA uracil-C5-methylase (TrmA/RlmC/RlmD family)